MMDAAEIAELRREWKHKPYYLSLLDALEQAQDINEFGFRALLLVEAQRDQAQKDAKDARALLEMMVTQNTYALPLDWRTRIEAMLEQKP